MEGQQRRKNNQRMYCKICKDSGKSDSECRSHNVRDRRGVSTCPTLASLTCGYCKKKGHTPKYCGALSSRRERVGSAPRNGNNRRGECNQPRRHRGNTQRAAPAATADNGWETVSTSSSERSYRQYPRTQHAHKPMYPEPHSVIMAWQREAAEKQEAEVLAWKTRTPKESRFASIASDNESDNEDSSDDESDFPSLASKTFGKRVTSWSSDDEDE